MKLKYLRPVSKDFPISSPFGKLRTLRIHGEIRSKPHLGIDIACPVGTPVRTPRAGVVYRAGWENPEDPKQGYGLRVVLKFSDPELGTIFCYLAHMTSIKVEAGQEVAEGTILGLSGNTGSSTGPHLHIESRASDMAQRFDMEFYDEADRAVA